MAGAQDAALNATMRAQRIAAVRFAIANGIALPAGELAVAHEVDFKLVHAMPPVIGAAEQELQAVAIAKAIRPDAKTGLAAQLLICKFSACAPATKASVLLIDQPRRKTESVWSVQVRLYQPTTNAAEYDALQSIGLVEIEEKAGIWTGARFALGPSTGKLRLPIKWIVRSIDQ